MLSGSGSVEGRVAGSAGGEPLPLVGELHGGGVGIATDTDIALDREVGIGVTQLVGDDGGVEAEVEEHPAGGDVAQVMR